MPSPSSRDIAAGLLGQVDHLQTPAQKKQAMSLLMQFAVLVGDHARLRGGKPSVWAANFAEVLDGAYDRLQDAEQRAADETHRRETLKEGDEYVLCFDWAERAEETEQAEQKAGEARKEEQA